MRIKLNLRSRGLLKWKFQTLNQVFTYIFAIALHVSSSALTRLPFALFSPVGVSLNEGSIAEESLRVDHLGVDAKLLQLLLELLWVAVELRELVWLEGLRPEANRNVGLDARQEVLCCISGRVRAHATDTADGHECKIRLVEVIYELHVAEQVRGAGVVEAQVVVRDVDDIAAGLTTLHHAHLGNAECGRRVGADHGDLDVVEVDRAARLHLAGERVRHLVHHLIVSGDLAGADDLPALLLAELDQVDRVERAVHLSAGNEDQVGIIWRLLLVLLRALVGADVLVEVEAALLVVLVLELDPEAAVAVPLDVDLTLHLVLLQRPLIESRVEKPGFGHVHVLLNLGVELLLGDCVAFIGMQSTQLLLELLRRLEFEYLFTVLACFF